MGVTPKLVLLLTKILQNSACLRNTSFIPPRYRKSYGTSHYTNSYTKYAFCVMKKYFILLKTPELEPHHQMPFSVLPMIALFLEAGLSYHSTRNTMCILNPAKRASQRSGWSGFELGSLIPFPTMIMIMLNPPYICVHKLICGNILLLVISLEKLIFICAFH